MNLRAKTNEEKAEVLQRILKVWQNDLPEMRLGQMLINLVEKDYQIFLIEDKTLADRLEEWSRKMNHASSSHTSSRFNNSSNRARILFTLARLYIICQMYI